MQPRWPTVPRFRHPLLRMASSAGLTIVSPYLRQPTMEYTQAFDMAAAILNAAAAPTLAVVSSAVHSVELLKRCPGPLRVAGTVSFDASLCGRSPRLGPSPA